MSGFQGSPDRLAMAPGSAILVGLLGQGIQLSRTPLMHEQEGEAQGLRYIYKLLDTDRMAGPIARVDELVRRAEDFGFTGLNVTYPYKQSIIKSLDVLSPAAKALGAVNTVVFKDGLKYGHNTDLWGFRESFRSRMSDRPLDDVVLIGAGGAGVAVAQGLLELGVEKLRIFDTDPERAAALAQRLNGAFGAHRAIALATLDDWSRPDGLVNATPIGMASKPGLPIDPALLHRDLWVADIIYFPLETELLKRAAALGCRTMGGEGMAILQAARAFELFTGLKPDIERMRATFVAFDS